MTTASTPRARSGQRRPARPGRQVGYLVAVAVNLAIAWVLTVSPGWRSVPFLAPEFAGVLGLVLVSLIAGMVANLVYVAADPLWVKRLGDTVTTAIACVVLARLWSVFPFDLGRWGGWETALRFVLAFLTIVTAIGALASLVEFVRLVAGSEGRVRPGSR